MQYRNELTIFLVLIVGWFVNIAIDWFCDWYPADNPARYPTSSSLNFKNRMFVDESGAFESKIEKLLNGNDKVSTFTIE